MFCQKIENKSCLVNLLTSINIILFQNKNYIKNKNIPIYMWDRCTNHSNMLATEETEGVKNEHIKEQNQREDHDYEQP